MFHKIGLTHLALLFLLMHVYRVLVEVIFGIKIGPDCECKNQGFLHPVDKTVSNVFGFDVGMNSKETSQSKSPLNWSEGIRISKNIFTL